MKRSERNTRRRRHARPTRAGSIAALSNACLALALLSGTGSVHEQRDLPETMPQFPETDGHIRPEVEAASHRSARPEESAEDVKPDLMPYYPHTQGAGARFVCPALRASAPLLPSRGLPGMERGTAEPTHRPRPD